MLNRGIEADELELELFWAVAALWAWRSRHLISLSVVSGESAVAGG